MNAKLWPQPIQGQNKYHYTLTVKEKGPRKKFSFKFPNVILPKREQTTVKKKKSNEIWKNFKIPSLKLITQTPKITLDFSLS